MKTFTKYLLLPLCCLFMAAGCGKDDLPTGGQPEGPGSETGILSFENWDLTVADDMEILPTDNAPGTSSTRSTVDAPDDYIVKIYNSKKEQVGSYTYAEIKTTGNIELPQDSYTVTAESPNYASIPDVAWETPVYYGEVSVNVIKKLTTTVNNLVCKLGNIKTTVDFPPIWTTCSSRTTKQTNSPSPFRSRTIPWFTAAPKLRAKRSNPVSSAQSIRTTP